MANLFADRNQAIGGDEIIADGAAEFFLDDLRLVTRIERGEMIFARH